MSVTKKIVRGVEVWHVYDDSQGNPGYVVHYTSVPYTKNERLSFTENQERHIRHACEVLGGREYRAEWFGGGIVFTTHDLEKLIEEVVA